MYFLEGGSFGVQPGAESTGVVLLVMNHRALLGAGAGSCAQRPGMDRRS